MLNKRTAAMSATLKPVPALVTVLIGLVIWFVPPPEGVDPKAWHLLAIFVATIVGIILKALPMGAMAIIAIALTALTRTLRVGDSLSGFANTTIWLIVLAFFVARGFIKTGLGRRIAYLFVALLGKRSLGLGYGLVATDLVLAPAIPSNTARAGGVVFPIMRSLAHAFQSEPDDGSARKIGSYLSKTAFQGTVITSAMFLTAMAANPLIVKFAADQGITLTWAGWAIAASVPGIVSLIVVPLVIYVLYPPEIKETPAATQLARRELQNMGPVSPHEWIMLAVFALLLVLWIFAPQLGGINATTTAMTGLLVLLVTGVLTWQDLLEEKGAWDTLVWFSALVMMATFLNKLGLIPWFSKEVGGMLAGTYWVTAFLILTLVYFYSHYFFASQTAHISAMYAAFLAVALALGVPPLFAALVLAFSSNLFSSLTHYGTGPAPVYFGAGYVELRTWWGLGFVISLVNIVIWVGLGGIWWKVLGLW
ncbi:MAG TPA: anion permease [bacterium]